MSADLDAVFEDLAIDLIDDSMSTLVDRVIDAYIP